MAKLFSHHDFMHAHACLGFLVLAHFVWRLSLALWYGTSFPSWESKGWQTLGLVLHWMLSLTALQFPLPQKRNFHAPMLWPEFRWHSITFASRHVVGTLLALWNVWPSSSSSSSLLAQIVTKWSLVVGTIAAASYISRRFGDKDRRTTNAMPYPESIDVATQATIKAMYAKVQFIATSACILEDLPTMAYWPLLAIQGAAFLMTLVRKGWISSLTYHRLYALALMVPYPVILAMVYHGTTKWQATFYANVAIAVARPLRFSFQWAAWKAWTVAVVVSVLGWHVCGHTLDHHIPQQWAVAAHVYFCIPFRFKVLLPYYNTIVAKRWKQVD